jgi:hypothetical protein
VAEIGGGFGPFAAQVRFFRRKLNVPSGAWNDLWREEHAHGFMVAGAFKADLLADIRELVDQAQTGKGSLPALSYDQFKRDFRGLVESHGWDPRGGADWRAHLIYDTNVRQAYNAGRYEQLTDPDTLAARPYWEYRHNHLGISESPRPEHQAWHGLVLRADDPWWDSHMPQNGFGCKCGVRALSARDLKKRGKAGPDTAPDDGTYTWTDKATGEQHAIPIGVDPGFDYNVGEASRSMPSAQRFGEKVMSLPPAWRDRTLADVATRADMLFADFDPMAKRILAGATARGDVQPAGFLSGSVVRSLPSPPPSALIAISDAEFANLARNQKQGLSKNLLRAIPDLITGADATFIDTEDQAMVYASKLPSGQVAKLVVALGQRGRSAPLRGEPVNWVTSGELVKAADLRPPRYVLIEGSL